MFFFRQQTKPSATGSILMYFQANRHAARFLEKFQDLGVVKAAPAPLQALKKIFPAPLAHVHVHIFLHCQIGSDAHILDQQLNGKPGIHLPHQGIIRQLLDGIAQAGAAGNHLHHGLCRDPGFHTQFQRLAGGDHRGAKEKVVHRFRRVAGAVATGIDDLFLVSHGPKQRQHLFHYLGIAAHQNTQCAALGPFRSAAHRGIQHLYAPGLHILADLPRAGGIRTTHIDVDEARMCPF